ncbi:MAG TPA: hypothetical protein VGL56_21050 [Fimbriimonadaceae bacterium]|jgi:hypothetical protein
MRRLLANNKPVTDFEIYEPEIIKVVEILPVSQKVWSIDGEPAEWRTISS